MDGACKLARKREIKNAYIIVVLKTECSNHLGDLCLGRFQDNIKMDFQ